MTRHLLWKDAMAIQPLLVALLLGIVAINVVLILTLSSQETNSANVFVSIWVLMPNLIALGAPALLVGSEEESGTLNWLRTLPVSWQKVADSKFLVAVGALAIAWLASSCLLWLLSTSGIVWVRPSTYAAEMTSLASVAYLVFFSLLLLVCGFITAYLFRSPVAGLIAVVPLIVIVTPVSAAAGRWILTGDIREKGIALMSMNPSSYLMAAMAGIALLAAAFALQRWLASRRLTAPHSESLKNIVGRDVDASLAYRPPVMVARRSRPRPSAALHWQQLRQVGRLSAALTVMVGVFLLLHFTVRSENSSAAVNWLREISPLPIALGASWLGSLVFYGDNVRRRCEFFADRGVSPTQVWWTRLLLPVSCCVFLVGFAALAMNLADPAVRSRGDGFIIAVIIIVMFACGQLVSQWSRRPILAFLAAPAYAMVMFAILMFVFSYYRNMMWSVTLVAPVLLFATWRLSARWLSGKTDFQYNWRVVAYSAIAVAIPMSLALATRVWTTPGAMDQWKSETLAIQLPKAKTFADGRIIPGDRIMGGAFHTSGFSPAFSHATFDEKRDLIQQELDSDQIGNYVSLDDLHFVLSNTGSRPTELHYSAIKTLLKWARQIREDVLAGEAMFWDLDAGAEQAEARAVDSIRILTDSRGTTPELKRLVDSIPSSDLRRESRRIALISEWKSYSRTEWSRINGEQVTYGKHFMGQAVANRVRGLPFERTRADRIVDKLTRLLLDHVDNGLPNTPSTFHQLGELWNEMIGPGAYYYAARMQRCRTWTSDHEKLIDLLRDRYADVTSDADAR